MDTKTAKEKQKRIKLEENGKRRSENAKHVQTDVWWTNALAIPEAMWWIDWLIELGLTSHSIHKIGHSKTFPQANLLAWYGKTKKPNTTKSMHSPIKINILQHKKHKELKPGSVAFYDIRPGNEVGILSKEQISKKSEDKRIRGEAYDINKQTIYTVSQKTRH